MDASRSRSKYCTDSPRVHAMLSKSDRESTEMAWNVQPSAALLFAGEGGWGAPGELAFCRARMHACIGTHTR